MNWILISNELPNEGEMVLTYGDLSTSDVESVNEVLDELNDDTINREEVLKGYPCYFSCVYSRGMFLFPDMDEGGLIDMTKSISHWLRPTPPQPNK